MVEIQFLIRLIFTKRIVKFELCILYCLGDAVYFVFAVVYKDSRIFYRNDIDFAIGKFLMKDWSLLKAHADLHQVGKSMVFLGLKLLFLAFDHGLEVHIHLNPL